MFGNDDDGIGALLMIILSGSGGLIPPIGLAFVITIRGNYVVTARGTYVVAKE